MVNDHGALWNLYRQTIQLLQYWQKVSFHFTICTKPFIQYNNEFDFHENERVGRIHFHMNDFAHRLVLTLREKVTQKWSIEQTEGDILVCLLQGQYNEKTLCYTKVSLQKISIQFISFVCILPPLLHLGLMIKVCFAKKHSNVPLSCYKFFSD